MKARVKLVDGMMFVGESGSGHAVVMDGAPEYGGRNIGIRPMFELKQGQVEAHILDFEDRDIYGKTLRVKPVTRLRGEAKFSSLDALIAQIGEDCRQTRSTLEAA